MPSIAPYKRKSNPVPQLTMDTLARLESLFVDKSWRIDKMQGISLYDRFCATLLNLSKDEQLFLIELTERFRRIDAGDYVGHLENLAYQVRCDYPSAHIILVPCLPEEEIGKVKSAGVALYDMESTPYTHSLGKCYIEINDLANIASSIRDGDIIILVDDFIGTGETALGAVAYAHKVLGPDFPNNRIKVISIVTQQVGKTALNNIGIDVYSTYIETKGISDYYSGQELIDAISLMNSIESKIKKLKDKYRFGYMQSEALVCMRRCPNNTFPIYWLGKDTAPYERR